MADIYFDSTVAGPGAGTSGDPYKALASHTQSASDILYLVAGSTFNENLTIAQNNISAYSIGSGAKPIINATTTTTGAVYASGRSDLLVDGISLNGANVYPGAGAHLLNCSDAIVRNCAIDDNNYGVRADNTGASDLGSITLTNNVITMTSAASDAIIVIWGTSANGTYTNVNISDNHIDSVTYQRGVFVLSRAAADPADTYRSDNFTIRNNTILNTTSRAISIYAIKGTNDIGGNVTYNIGDGTLDCHVINIQNSNNLEIYDNHIDKATALTGGPAGTGVGIYCDHGTVGANIYNNFITNCGEGGGGASFAYGGSGIYVYEATDIAIWGNIVDTCRNGIAVDYGTDVTFITDNITIYNNTVYASTTDNFYIRTTVIANAVTMKNNISLDPGSSHIQRVGTNAIVADNNDYFPNTGTPFIWNITAYNFADWQTNSSVDAASIVTDPLFLDATNGNFTLGAASPCTGTGTQIDDIYDYYDRPFRQGSHDMGALRASQGLIPTGLYKTHLSRSKLRKV